LKRKITFLFLFLLGLSQVQPADGELINPDPYLAVRESNRTVKIAYLNREVLSLPAAPDFQASLERGRLIRDMLSRLISAGVQPEALTMERQDRLFVARYDDLPVFFVTEDDAGFFNLTQEELARQWLNQVRIFLALGNASITDTSEGAASWYGEDFHGRRTSNGETFDMHQLTAAHKTLPFGTQVLVTNVRNGRSVLVKINDRGPFKPNRVIDLSYAAARQIGVTGVSKVILEVLR
jgi:rare lipoprotein A